MTAVEGCANSIPQCAAYGVACRGFGSPLHCAREPACDDIVGVLFGWSSQPRGNRIVCRCCGSRRVETACEENVRFVFFTLEATLSLHTAIGRHNRRRLRGAVWGRIQGRPSALRSFNPPGSALVSLVLRRIFWRAPVGPGLTDSQIRSLQGTVILARAECLVKKIRNGGRTVANSQPSRHIEPNGQRIDNVPNRLGSAIRSA